MEPFAECDRSAAVLQNVRSREKRRDKTPIPLLGIREVIIALLSFEGLYITISESQQLDNSVSEHT